MVDLHSGAIATVCLRTSVSFVTVSSDGKYVLVANGNYLSVFDGNHIETVKDQALLNDIQLEGGIGGIGLSGTNAVYAWLPGTPRLFVYNPNGL